MMKFCKILEDENETQFLIMKGLDEENDNLYISVTFEMDNQNIAIGMMDIKLGANDEKHQQQMFDDITLEACQSYKENLYSQFGLDK